MRTNYIKRTSKGKRQEALDVLLEESLEILRRRIFPHKRKPLLNNKIKIVEKDFDDLNVAGQYHWDEDKKIHNIYVSKNHLYNMQKIPLVYYRRNWKYNIMDTIRHELIHAFVQEKWEWIYSDIKNKNADASPIFLAILSFVSTNSGHKCMKGFIKTKLFDFVKHSCRTYEQLEDYLLEYLYDLNKEIKDLKDINNKENYFAKKDKNLYVINNNFEFAGRCAGFRKWIETKQINKYTNILTKKTDKQTVIVRTWQIGCNTPIKKIKNLYNKKEMQQAKLYKITENLVALDKKAYKKNIKDIKDTDLKSIEYKKVSNL